MTDADLARIEALLAAAREVEGCSDHGCVLRVYPRGGQGTNGGCGCIGRNRTDEGLLVQADRLDLVRLLTLARQTPALVAEVERLRSWGSVSETLAKGQSEMLERNITRAEGFVRERDEALAEVERLRSIVGGRTEPPSAAEMAKHGDDGGSWLVTLPARKQVRFAPETRYVSEPAEVSRLWWCEGALWVPVIDGRPCAWPVVPSP